MTQSTNSAADNLELDNQLCFAVYSAAHAFTRLYAILLEPYGLTYTQYLTLLVLWEHDGLTVKEIGERLSLDSGTLTPVLRRLEMRDLLLRERDQNDQRRVNIHLTEAGHGLYPEISRARSVIFHATHLSAETLSDLKGQLDRLRRKLDEAHERLEQERESRPIEALQQNTR